MTSSANTWTDDRVETLSKLWREGMSASQIARDLGHGITRNAVIGKSTGWALQAARRRACQGLDVPISAGNDGVASRTGPSRLAPCRRPWRELLTFLFPRPGSPASSASVGDNADGRWAIRWPTASAYADGPPSAAPTAHPTPAWPTDPPSGTTSSSSQAGPPWPDRRQLSAREARRVERPPLRAGATPPHNALSSCHVTLAVNGLRPFPSASRRRAALR